MLWVLPLVFIFLLLAIAVVKLHPFPALMLAAILTGVLNKLPIHKIIAGINNGMGSTLGPVAAVIGLGVMLGALLTESGAATAISNRLLQQWGAKRVQAAVLLTAFICGIALFYNVGFVVLLPLVLTLAQQAKLPAPFLALSMAAALSVTHGYLPPHPGPTAITQLLGASTGKTLLYGLVAAIPAVLIGGWWFPKTVKHLQPQTPAGMPPAATSEKPTTSFSTGLLLALLPVLLMTTGVVLQQSTDKNSITTTVPLLADPLLALLISFIIALIVLSRFQKHLLFRLSEKAAAALPTVAGIIFIIAGGGALKQMLVDTGTAQAVSKMFLQWRLHPLLAAWLVATAVRIAIGSATVAGITAAGVVQPLIRDAGASPELMVLAIGAGSLMCSHLNDSGFWMFKEYLGLSVADTFRSWTVMETLVGTTGLAMVLLLNQFI